MGDTDLQVLQRTLQTIRTQYATGSLTTEDVQRWIDSSELVTELNEYLEAQFDAELKGAVAVAPEPGTRTGFIDRSIERTKTELAELMFAQHDSELATEYLGKTCQSLAHEIARRHLVDYLFNTLVQSAFPIHERTTLSSIPSEHAQDILQDSGLRFLKRVHRRSDIASWTAYLNIVVLHRLIDWSRKRRRSHEANQSSVEQAVAPDSDEDIDEQELYRAIEPLPDDEREIVEDFYLSGKTGGEAVEAISARTGKSRAEVYRRLKSIREKLRSILNSDSKDN